MADDYRYHIDHHGSLVRPPALIDYLRKIDANEAYDKAAFEKCLTDSVAEAVQQSGFPRMFWLAIRGNWPGN